MSIGAGIFLMVVGAVLAFAVRDSWDAVNLTVVGYILMLAGLAGITLSFYITNRRRRVQTDAIDPAVEEEYRVVEEHHRDVQE
jgi:membrane protein implicated in regulation of membrane protease activity